MLDHHDRVRVAWQHSPGQDTNTGPADYLHPRGAASRDFADQPQGSGQFRQITRLHGVPVHRRAIRWRHIPIRSDDRVNHGRLGPKGLHGWVANNSQDRLLHPLVRKRGELRQATWDEAMDLVVQRTKEYRDRYTPSSIAFYTTGQLFIEEYYTLAAIGKAGLGTPHMDGNTRLCTATAEHAMMASFGSDGQVASYEDIDHTDCLLIVGHNPAATGTVLWMRMLDRRRRPRPPRLVVIDPRKTDTAAEADVHLAPRIGTNVPVLSRLCSDARRKTINAGKILGQTGTTAGRPIVQTAFGARGLRLPGRFLYASCFR